MKGRRRRILENDSRKTSPMISYKSNFVLGLDKENMKMKHYLLFQSPYLISWSDV